MMSNHQIWLYWLKRFQLGPKGILLRIMWLKIEPRNGPCCQQASIYLIILYSGWWLTYPSEKYEFVSWDDDIPNFPIYGK